MLYWILSLLMNLMAKKETKVEKTNKTELIALLKKKLPQCFEREPNSGYTPNLEKLADEIDNLYA